MQYCYFERGRLLEYLRCQDLRDLCLERAKNADIFSIFLGFSTYSTPPKKWPPSRTSRNRLRNDNICVYFA